MKFQEPKFPTFYVVAYFDGKRYRFCHRKFKTWGEAKKFAAEYAMENRALTSVVHLKATAYTDFRPRDFNVS